MRYIHPSRKRYRHNINLPEKCWCVAQDMAIALEMSISRFIEEAIFAYPKKKIDEWRPKKPQNSSAGK